jgi:hypothetical protein
MFVASIVILGIGSKVVPVETSAATHHKRRSPR